MPRGNVNNLKKIQSTEEAREKGKKGGQKSGERRREKRELKYYLNLLLEGQTVKVSGNKKITGAEALATKLFEKALKGDIKAFEVLRDTVGQKPVERVVVSEIDPDVVSEVEELLNGVDV